MVHRRDDKVLDQVVGTGVMEEVEDLRSIYHRCGLGSSPHTEKCRPLPSSGDFELCST